MDLKEFRVASQRTFSVIDGEKKDFEHCVSGVVTEFGELVDIYKKELAYEKEIDRVNLGEEVADILFYLVNMISDEEAENFAEYDVATKNPEILDQFKLAWEESNILFICEALSRFLSDSTDTENILTTIYYLKTFCLTQDLDFEKILDNNVAKLLVRFPEGFSKENAENRDLEKEHEALAN